MQVSNSAFAAKAASDNVFKVVEEVKSIKVLAGTTTLLELPHLWLRDSCTCNECRVSKTQEKAFILSEVPADICPIDVSLVGQVLSVEWPDRHQTQFCLEDVLGLSLPRTEGSLVWSEMFQPSYFDWSSFLTDDTTARSLFKTFLDYGVVVISGAPQDPDALELLAPRLGPIREVLFERIHNVCVDTHVYNVAHTPMALPPHNDFASYTFPPSVQALHMLHNEAQGGKSIIVDAWAIAESIRAERPDYFAILCQFSVPFREFDVTTETYTEAPIIHLDVDGCITNVRFSNQLMQTIDPRRSDVDKFYDAYHYLCCRITDEANRVTFRLEGGHVLLVAAHRVLHAREAFVASGIRHLQDAYYELDNIANNFYLLNTTEANDV